MPMPAATVALQRATLAKRTVEGDGLAALELCRDLEGWKFTDVIAGFFAGQLTTVVFDRLCDAHHRATEERALDAQLGPTVEGGG